MNPETEKDPPFVPADSVIEVVSWRLIAELLRRHPDIGTLIETHPGCGQYDCLTIIRDGQSIASLNRRGSFTPSHRFEGKVSYDEIWLPCLADQGFSVVLNKLSKALGLLGPKKLPKTTAEVLVYRVIAGLLSYSVLDKTSMECRNGQMDSSGYDTQAHREEWFRAFPEALAERDQLNRLADAQENPNYRFWFILRSDDPVLGLVADGKAYTKGGLSIDLMEIYRRRRKLEDVIGALIPHCA